MSINTEVMGVRTSIRAMASSLGKSQKGKPVAEGIRARMQAIAKKIHAIETVPEPLRTSFEELKVTCEKVEQELKNSSVVSEGIQRGVEELKEKVDNFYKKILERAISSVDETTLSPSEVRAEEGGVEDLFSEMALIVRLSQFARDNPRLVAAVCHTLHKLRSGEFGENLQKAFEESDPAVISQESILRLVLFGLAHDEWTSVVRRLPEGVLAVAKERPEEFFQLIDDLKRQDTTFLEKVLLGSSSLTSGEESIKTIFNRFAAKLRVGADVFQLLLRYARQFRPASAPTVDRAGAAPGVVADRPAALLSEAVRATDFLAMREQYAGEQMDRIMHIALSEGDDDRAVHLLQNVRERAPGIADEIASRICAGLHDPVRQLVYIAQISSSAVRQPLIEDATYRIQYANEEMDRLLSTMERFRLYDLVPNIVHQYWRSSQPATGVALLYRLWNALALPDHARIELMKFLVERGGGSESADRRNNLTMWRQIT